jgi:hypothetical protein
VPAPVTDDICADFAAIALPKGGETQSGDGWRLQRRGDQSLLMVADGLGHGLQAADAANAALAVMDRSYDRLDALMHDVHGALRATRGAAIGIARTDGRTLEFLGVGNIACRVAAAATADGPALDKQLVSHNGTVGHALRRMDSHRVALPAQSVVILHSDGLSSRFTLDDFPNVLSRPPALIAGALFQRLARRNDDATIAVLRPRADA